MTKEIIFTSQHDKIFLTEMLNKNTDIFCIQMIEDFNRAAQIDQHQDDLIQALKLKKFNQDSEEGIYYQEGLVGPVATAGLSSLNRNEDGFTEQVVKELIQELQTLKKVFEKRIEVIQNWLEDESTREERQNLLIKYLGKNHASLELRKQLDEDLGIYSTDDSSASA